MSTVLLVEDDHWLAESYQHVLERAGFTVQIAHGITEALRNVDSSVPDVLVVDMLLDDTTAMSLLHELQSYDDTRTIPVVLCTALTHPSITADTLHGYGVRAVLDKATLTPEQFVTVLQEVCV